VQVGVEEALRSWREVSVSGGHDVLQHGPRPDTPVQHRRGLELADHDVEGIGPDAGQEAVERFACAAQITVLSKDRAEVQTAGR
jgi:hypothetical protein